MLLPQTKMLFINEDKLMNLRNAVLKHSPPFFCWKHMMSSPIMKIAMFTLTTTLRFYSCWHYTYTKNNIVPLPNVLISIVISFWVLFNIFCTSSLFCNFLSNVHTVNTKMKRAISKNKF